PGTRARRAGREDPSAWSPPAKIEAQDRVGRSFWHGLRDRPPGCAGADRVPEPAAGHLPLAGARPREQIEAGRAGLIAAVGNSVDAAVEGLDHQPARIGVETRTTRGSVRFRTEGCLGAGRDGQGLDRAGLPLPVCVASSIGGHPRAGYWHPPAECAVEAQAVRVLRLYSTGWIGRERGLWKGDESTTAQLSVGDRQLAGKSGDQR